MSTAHAMRLADRMRAVNAHTRCDYCNAAAVEVVQKSAWTSRMGHRRKLHWKRGACAAHIGCASWASVKGGGAHV
jgi:hypothetical protein